MSDSYQAIYDAAFQAFDISYHKDVLVQEFSITAAAMRSPSVLYRPTLSLDGNMWCALLGDDLQVGLAGFGESPSAAMDAFDAAFIKKMGE